MLIPVNQREFDTILAALRNHQISLDSGFVPLDVLEIATNGREGDDACLTSGEIDDLCERINCAPPVKVYAATYTHKYGEDTRVFGTQSAAYAWRDEIGREWWVREISDEKPSENIGEKYFEEMEGRETFSVEECVVEGADDEP